MTIIETFPTLCADFSQEIRSLVGLRTDRLLSGLSAALSRVRDKRLTIDADLLDPDGEGYSRHLLYADEAGLFSIMLLVWRRGAFSPVHSHWTWCGYVVLDGVLREERLSWNVERRRAVVDSCIQRVPGNVVVSGPGLHDIHRLGNLYPGIAVSLHVYGVSEEATSTHVNRVLPV